MNNYTRDELLRLADKDEDAHEEAAQMVVNFAFVEDLLREEGKEEAADDLHDMTQSFLNDAPNSVYHRSVEIESNG